MINSGGIAARFVARHPQLDWGSSSISTVISHWLQVSFSSGSVVIGNPMLAYNTSTDWIPDQVGNDTREKAPLEVLYSGDYLG